MMGISRKLHFKFYYNWMSLRAPIFTGSSTCEFDATVHVCLPSDGPELLPNGILNASATRMASV